MHVSIVFFCVFAVGISGYVGMWVSVRANQRVASAAGRNKYDEALCIALKGSNAPVYDASFL